MGKVNENLEKIHISREQLKKASEVCAQLKKTFEENSTEVIEEKLINEPASVLLNDPDLEGASKEFVALAAFVAKAVEGIQDSIKELTATVQALVDSNSSTSEAVVKAISNSLDISKANFVTPSTQFQATKPLNKADLPPQMTKGEILEKMEALVQEGQLSPVELSKFESTGRVPDFIKAKIL